MCRIEVLALILILKGIGCKAELVEAPRHTLKKCTQDGLRRIQCHEFENDGMGMVSQWPPGPYVIPMSRYGCPESSMHGWREGYLMITWKEPQSTFIQSEIVNDAPVGFSDMFTSTSSEPLFNASERHYVHYPSTQNNIKLNFCYKYRSNVSVDAGSWPDESFRILATEHSCPTGFNMEFSNVSLPSITHWESDGYLPDLSIINDGKENILNIKLCSRRKKAHAKDNSTSVQAEHLLQINETTAYRNWTCFVLIKNRNDSCPKFRDTVVFEETLYIENHGEIGSPIIQLFDASCFYELKTDEDYWLYENRRKNAYSVNPASLSKGYTIKPAETKKGSLFSGFFFSVPKQTNSVHFWKVVDLGRTIPVSSVEITMNRDLIDKVNVCESRVFGCFISREKWSFLYFEAISCLSVPFCRVTGLSTSLVFKRIIEGRYITVFHTEEQDVSTKVVTLNFYSVTVFTEMIDYDGTDSCNIDLYIEDWQILDSYWIKRLSQNSLYITGWCPTFDAIQPYIKFVFPFTTTIEGLTVYLSRVELSTVASFGDLSLVLTYSEENNSTERKILKADPSKTNQGTRSFWFLTPIHATEVKLTMAREKLSHDLTWFRFQVHGCWPSGRNVPMSIYAQTRETPPYEIGGYISEINAFGSVLTNIDHQTNYKRLESYKWIIQFPKSHYIKLVFTQIVFIYQKDLYEDDRDRTLICNDSLVISNDLVNVSPDTTRVIDGRFMIKLHSLSIETKETQLVLTMLQCSLTSIKSSFKAYATYQEMPTCFSINARLDQWHRGSEEICRHPSMFITAMSVLGFPFKNTTERWTISVPSKRISLQFIEFNVPCLTYEVKPALRLIDMSKELSYCNIYRPPDRYNSSSDNLTVVYHKDDDIEYENIATVLEGFKLVYSVIEEQERRFVENITFNENRNVALYKPAYQSDYFFKLADCLDRNCAGHIVDGLTFFEAGLFQISSCRVGRLQSEKLPLAWLIDLLDIYTLDYVVLYGGTIVNETCLITLSTGLAAHETKATGVICGSIVGGRIINQQGIKARFVRIEVDCYEFSLCEVQVYGILESLLSETATVEFVSKVNLPIVVDGEWGLWSAWSGMCNCGGTQYRRRHCDDPRPGFTGRYCPGASISYRLCTNITTPCDDLSLSIGNGDFCKEFTTVTGQRRFSSWSDWSTCSSNCSRGEMSRSRRCLVAGQTDNVQKCLGILTEEKPCLGNKTCFICPDAFRKCYSIIQKYTNWEQARLECMIRNTTLVSIMSLTEMRLLKYLLRQRRQTDGLPINYFKASFFAHIGLHQTQNSKNQIPVWENGFNALYFTAWKEREPSEGKCTRMSFRQFDDDNTWESEDCKHQLAEYTVCEYQKQRTLSSVVKTMGIWKDLETNEVTEHIPVEQYDGNVSVTISGKRCNDTLCREVEGMRYIGCKNVEGVYEECSVKLPPKLEAGVVFEKYLGSLNKSFSGKTCQRWDSKLPHIHAIHGNLFRGESISDAANYCRDVGDVGILWCFTVDTLQRWEPCLTQEIKTQRQCITILKYSGTKNTTWSGKTCLRWDSKTLIDMGSSELDLTKTENYCRDPYNYGFNWCYIKSSFQGETWEPCQIEDKTETISESRSQPHVTDSFVCSNGEEVIPKYLMCNGKFDCRDKSDETKCLSIYKSHTMATVNMNFINTSSFEGSSFFSCTSGELISVVTRCDSVIDCLDASDETDCEFNSSGILEKCMKDQFKCDDGDCVHISLVCNHVTDCIDGSDEYCDFDNCFPVTEYQCRTGQCIPLQQLCDAVENCPDGSDETECDECQSEAFLCDGVCKPLRLRCDKVKHCKDGTDEILCDPGNFMSCQDVWLAGYRETGLYKLVDVHAYCNFDNIFANGKLETRINYDFNYLKFPFGWQVTVAVFYNIISTVRESRTSFLIFDREDGNCTQEVTRKCLPTFEVVAHLRNISNCTCSVHSFDISHGRRVLLGDSKEKVEICQSTFFKNWTREVQAYKPINIFTQTDLERQIFMNNKKNSTQQYLPGPAICVHDFKPTDNHFPCNVNGKQIPMILRCVYDIDSSGFAVGCSDGSHLHNCETYVCPQNTLKCPGSYCIPHRFLCDGKMQCPGGDDESNCGCLPSRNEILVLHDTVSSDGLNVARFARQFYTQTNIVRILSFDASKPFLKFGMNDILMEVRDIEINASPDFEETFDCSYKIFARNVLNSVYFTNDGLKGIIVIQSSEASKEVFNSIIENKRAIKPDVKIYRVSLYSDEIELDTQNTTVKRYTDVKLRRWRYLDGVGAEYFSELCTIASKIHCQGGYKCSSSKVCIPVSQVCDDQEQCLHGDDEAICEFRCPVNCICSGYFSNCSAALFSLTMLSSIPRQTRHLDISLNENLRMVLQDIYLSFSKMSVLNVSACEIEVVSRFGFSNLRNLRTLDLSNNKIKILSNKVFVNLVHLTKLYLGGNSEMALIETTAFYGLSLVQDLDISNAKLSKILADTFVGLNLKNIDLANNNLQEIESYAFRSSFIENINFENNDIKSFHKEMFIGLVGLKTLRTPAFKFCCIRPNYVLEENCYPHQDEFSSCDDLMRHSGLQFMIWLIGIMAFLGNVLSIVYRMKYDRERLKLGYGIFVTNLAVADFLMAIYLLIIAIADSAFRKKYIYVDDYWRHSIWCTIAGVLSTASSEASVLFLCLITLDRIIVVKFPFGNVKITSKKATVSAVFAWIFSFFTALFPVSYRDYFKNEFYSKSGVCIALPLTRDRPPGWAYSLAVFVCLNFITFILVALGQLAIFLEMNKHGGIATSAASTRKRDLKVARNLLLVVASDFLCWFPIGVMGMLALTGHPVSGEVYAWAAVFILPVNSALNPILYTLSAIIGAKKFSPSIDEQSFLALSRDIGQNSMKCVLAGRILSSRRNISTFRKIGTLSGTDVEIRSAEIVKIATNLSLCLDALHSCSLGMNPLDENTVLVGIRKGKLTGSIRIDGEPFLTNKPVDKQKNIYQLGILLKRLMVAKKTKN